MGLRRKPPVQRRDIDSWTVRLEVDEREVLSTVMRQLDDLIEHAETGAELSVVNRLFPPAFTHHESEHEELDLEYQRLMREELIAARRAAIAESRGWLAEGDSERVIDEANLTAMLRSLNSLRLALGSLLGITDDLDSDLADEAVADSPDHQLYAWTGWLLEWTVTALSSAD